MPRISSTLARIPPTSTSSTIVGPESPKFEIGVGLTWGKLLSAFRGFARLSFRKLFEQNNVIRALRQTTALPATRCLGGNDERPQLGADELPQDGAVQVQDPHRPRCGAATCADQWADAGTDDRTLGDTEMRLDTTQQKRTEATGGEQ